MTVGLAVATTEPAIGPAVLVIDDDPLVLRAIQRIIDFKER